MQTNENKLKALPPILGRKKVARRAGVSMPTLFKWERNGSMEPATSRVLTHAVRTMAEELHTLLLDALVEASPQPHDPKP